jgi:hypothetical protein
MKKYKEGKQPCDNFNLELNENGTYDVHECPVCKKRRVFCENCCRDHHENGWETCNVAGAVAVGL